MSGWLFITGLTVRSWGGDGAVVAIGAVGETWRINACDHNSTRHNMWQKNMHYYLIETVRNLCCCCWYQDYGRELGGAARIEGGPGHHQAYV